MKKLITMVVTLLIMATNAQAELQLKGVVEKVDIEHGLVIINSTPYKVQHGKTKLITGKRHLDLGVLSVGSQVDFILDNSFVTEIKLTSPYTFKD